MIEQEFQAITFDTLQDITFSGKEVTQDFSSYVEELNMEFTFSSKAVAIL